MTALAVHLRGMRASIRPTRRLDRSRLWQVDALRGVAILMMVIYHFVWDLRGLGGYDIAVYTGFWHYFQQATASLFIGLVGVSLTLSRRQAGPAAGWGRYLRRGAIIFSWGVVVGLVTFAFDPPRYVRFGILHLIGATIVLAYPFLGWRWRALGLGLLLLFLGQVFPRLGWHLPWLDWLGLDSTPRAAFDYFPLIPWFGVALIGIFLGNSFAGQRPAAGETRGPLPWLRLLGQNSLLIYLIHQPILITLLILAGIVRL